MLCCVCKEKEAKVHLTQIVGEKMQKVDLCEQCAAQKGVNDPQGFSLADLLLGLGASQEMEQASGGPDVKCPNCGFTQADFKKAGRLGCSECYVTFAEGLDTVVRERGANFSAGERQLVSLVRAALADPEVVVLDEATSSLDPGTELLVGHSIERLMAGRTVVVIAHRLSTSARADRVAVVHGGRIVEVGHHDDLVDAGGAYAALYASWMGTGT